MGTLHNTRTPVVVTHRTPATNNLCREERHPGSRQVARPSYQPCHRGPITTSTSTHRPSSSASASRYGHCIHEKPPGKRCPWPGGFSRVHSFGLGADHGQGPCFVPPPRGYERLDRGARFALMPGVVRRDPGRRCGAKGRQHYASTQSHEGCGYRRRGDGFRNHSAFIGNRSIGKRVAPTGAVA